MLVGSCLFARKPVLQESRWAVNQMRNNAFSLLIILISACMFCEASDVQAAEPTKVTFPGDQGLTLEGFLYRPEGPGPFPAVVALHGCSGLTGKDGEPS